MRACTAQQRARHRRLRRTLDALEYALVDSPDPTRTEITIPNCEAVPPAVATAIGQAGVRIEHATPRGDAMVVVCV